MMMFLFVHVSSCLLVYENAPASVAAR